MSEKLAKEVAADKIIDFVRYEEVLQLKTPDQLWKYMHENIKYGWTNKKGEFREYNDSRQHKEYYLHSPQETVERKSGICGDQVLLEKAWFNHHNIENHIISFGFKDDNGKRIGGGHVFLVYIMDGKYYYFENAFAPCANIIEFNTLKELIGTVIAAYLTATNNTEKTNKLYVTIDGHLSIGNDTNKNYEETINDKDIYENYIKDVKIEIKKFLS